MIIKTENLKLAEVRYFDVERNGLEFTPPLSHVVLLNRGDTYVSLLNCGDFAPIYKRNKSKSNVYSDDGEYFGTKIELVYGNLKDGEAWLLTDTDFTKVFGSEEVDMDTVEQYVLASDLFFKDRLELVESNAARHGLPFFTIRSIVKKDEKSIQEMQDFFSEREKQKVKKK